MRIFLILGLLFLAACPAYKAPDPEPSSPQPEPHPKANCPYVYVEGSEFHYRGKPFPLKAANYFPAAYSWRNMWLNWQPATIKNEIKLISALGVNTIRIFIPDRDFSNRDGSLNQVMLSRLDSVLEISEANDIRVIVTLFMWSNYDPKALAKDKAHAQRIVSKYASDSRILAWDISNELDHRWNSGKRTFQEMRRFALEIAEVVRSVDLYHLLFCGEYGHFLGNRTEWDGKSINPDLSRLTLPIENVDAVCFHWYGHNAALENAVIKIRKLTNKPILIEEIGLPTDGKQKGEPWPLNESQIAGYTRAWLNVASKHNVYLAYWSGFDFEAAGTGHLPEGHTELHFGLYDIEYRLKANGAAFKDSQGVISADSDLPKINHYRRYDD